VFTVAVRRRVWTTRKGEPREAWIAEYSFFTKDGVRKQAIKTFGTKKEAKAFRDKTGVDVREGKHVPDRASINIREAAEIWFKAVKSGRNGRPPAEASTLRQYRTHIDHHILPELGPVKL
jgi:integrase